MFDRAASEEEAMNVRELIELLRAWPEQEATVVVSDGVRFNRWLFATGIVARRIGADTEHPDFAISGTEPGIEIV